MLRTTAPASIPAITILGWRSETTIDWTYAVKGLSAGEPEEALDTLEPNLPAPAPSAVVRSVDGRGFHARED